MTADIHGKRRPATDDLRAALDFGADSQNLLVWCRAGQSRSAATAFLICYRRLGPDAARRLLNPERHVPNSLVVDLRAANRRSFGHSEIHQMTH